MICLRYCVKCIGYELDIFAAVNVHVLKNAFGHGLEKRVKLIVFDEVQMEDGLLWVGEGVLW
jgi:hypothetical protein